MFRRRERWYFERCFVLVMVYLCTNVGKSSRCVGFYGRGVGGLRERWERGSTVG